MKENFTAQQREIVARKMGYEGPMNLFDDYLASTPSDANKYSNITAKIAERMAKGGMVKKRRYAIGGVVDDTATGGGGTNYVGNSATTVSTDTSTISNPNVITKKTVGGPTELTTEQKAAAKQFADALKGMIASGDEKGAKQFYADKQKATGFTDEEISPFINDGAFTPSKIAEWKAAGTTTSYTDQQIKDAIVASREQGFTDAQSAEGAATKFGVGKERFDAILAGMKATPTSVTTDAAGKPLADVASAVTASQIVGSTAQNLSTTNYGADKNASTIASTGQAKTTQAGTPIDTSAASYTADTASENLKKKLDLVNPLTGTVSTKSEITAQEKKPEETILSTKTTAAADETDQKVLLAPLRTLGEAEKVSGSAVVQTDVEKALAKAKAAEGEVTAEMTVQGQLNKLMKDFDSGNPPPWAAANLRNVTAVLAARGLGASSLAGQALIQATLESALPIASADAQAYQSVAAQNLSNKQQTAVLVAQQRAAFLGQEFDQKFQTRVINAAKVSDVANMQFSADQQIALENARLAQTMDLANLSNKQAVVMAKAAQMANLETTNLNFKQQAAVENAKSFLAMDMANLSNEQQLLMFKTQATVQTLLSDQAASNASLQFNAANKQQSDQFDANLASQVSQFNAAQSNAVSQFNTDQTNAVSKFNAEVQNQRDQFNATQRLVIDQSNAQWQREISTANTAATNAANSLNAQLTQQMSIAEYNNETQMYRDAVTHAWTSSENDAQRATTLAAAEIDAAARMAAGQFTADAATSASVGTFFTKLLLG
jgi:hypothetical protein